MTHTPGPWKIATTYAQAQAGKHQVVPWASQRQPICKLSARPDYPPEQAEADARLIARSPDMQATLQKAHVFLSESILPSYPADHPMRDNIRALLSEIRSVTQAE